MTTQNRLQWDIQQNASNLMVLLSGDLTRDTLLPLWEQRASFLNLSAHKQLYWNLAGLTRVDSAGFALLCELINHYQTHTQCVLTNVPESVQTLVELFGLEQWLNTFLLTKQQ